ncbi:MAG: hypothetical protein GY854_01205 [Deltaproteobacteria bacterium]|nr:hypothetical protein [Deltaproteobacteria bacterium]
MGMGQNQKLRLSINRMLAHFGDPAIPEEREIEFAINQMVVAIDHQQQMNSRATMHMIPPKRHLSLTPSTDDARLPIIFPRR